MNYSRRIASLSLTLVSTTVAACVLFAIPGCGGVREEQIQIRTSDDPLTFPRSLLERYAKGEPLGSESTGFAKLAEDVKKVDKGRGEILEAGFKRLTEANPEERAGIATSLLEQIQPSAAGK